eukprot:TRINITY_DN9695_c0_g1_i1.p1 TRINITY_DN9695_c0_g1~~TRINITY_DN9695_c0_g1_i1.p1  ORF type:complete len:394 (+),score=125.22 TRINITY_DN9695_c0_g1_i1:52-1182(+)
MYSEDSMSTEEEEYQLSSPVVVDKYRAAGQIANQVLLEIIGGIQPGQTALEVCEFGDKRINEMVASVYQKKNFKKGVAFPTCVSVNNCAGHFSPMEGESNTLQVMDVVKIDLGVHIDGCISTAAHTIILGQDPAAGPLNGPVANAICAAHFASECAVRLLRPGKTNYDITRAIEKVAEVFGVTPVSGVLSHNIKRYVIDGAKVIIGKSDIEYTVEEEEFEVNEAYAIDIVMSTGDGKCRELEQRTTIFNRIAGAQYAVRLGASHYVLKEMNEKFSNLPFTLRSFDHVGKAKLGMVELLEHELVHPYPVLFEKDGETVVQFKFTALILQNQTMKLNEGLPLPFVNSEATIDSVPELKQIMQMSTKRSKKKKKRRRRR